MQCIVERDLAVYQRQIDAEEAKQMANEMLVAGWIEELEEARQWGQISKPAFKFLGLCIELALPQLDDWIHRQLEEKADQSAIDAAELRSSDNE